MERAAVRTGYRPLSLCGLRTEMNRGLAKRGMQGFTLVEVVITAAIFAVAAVALMAGFLSGLMLVESGRTMATASADARTVLEEMRRQSGSGLNAVTQVNWPTWARTTGALTSLENERVSVSYRNPAADPLEATVTVNWTERNRARSATFTGLVTRR